MKGLGKTLQWIVYVIHIQVWTWSWSTKYVSVQFCRRNYLRWRMIEPSSNSEQRIACWMQGCNMLAGFVISCPEIVMNCNQRQARPNIITPSTSTHVLHCWFINHVIIKCLQLFTTTLICGPCLHCIYYFILLLMKSAQRGDVIWDGSTQMLAVCKLSFFVAGLRRGPKVKQKTIDKSSFQPWFVS